MQLTRQTFWTNKNILDFNLCLYDLRNIWKGVRKYSKKDFIVDHHLEIFTTRTKLNPSYYVAKSKPQSALWVMWGVGKYWKWNVVLQCISILITTCMSRLLYYSYFCKFDNLPKVISCFQNHSSYLKWYCLPKNSFAMW